MYPDWPETAADLVPQPLCDGPKLAAFDFNGPQQIEFLKYLGEGSHAHVLKVRIHEKEYALKLVSDPSLSPPTIRTRQIAVAYFCRLIY